jgi:hypothetical protein
MPGLPRTRHIPTLPSNLATSAHSGLTTIEAVAPYGYFSRESTRRSGLSRLVQLRQHAGSHTTLPWREMDSNFRYRGAKAADFRSIPGIAGVSAGLLNDTTGWFSPSSSAPRTTPIGRASIEFTILSWNPSNR